MNYQEFLQTPYLFVSDVINILDKKNKWGLSLTRQEKMLKRYITRLYSENK